MTNQLQPRFLNVTLLVLTVMAPALAHDYWLQPDSFFLSVGAKVKVHLYVGENLAGQEEREFQQEPTTLFQLISTAETQDLSPFCKEGRKPFTQITAKSPGNYLIALERKARTITMDAKKFTDYLNSEGLDAVIAERAKAGEEHAQGRERYYRYIKSLLQVGKRQDDTYGRLLRQRLEIVPQANPYALKTGDSLTVRVLFEGEPLGGAKLFADCRNSKGFATQTVRTADDGTAVVTLDRPGIWLLHLVHMRRCGVCSDVDWESFWAAYTFGRTMDHVK